METNEYWRMQYMKLVAESAEADKKWAARIETLIKAQLEQIEQFQEECSLQAEKGYAEAYGIITELQKRLSCLETKT